MSEGKSGIKDYLGDLIASVVLLLWLIASEATEMQPSLALTGGLVIFVIVVIFLISRRYFEDKRVLAKLKAQEEIEKTRIFYDSTRPLASESEKKSIERMAREKTYLAIISAFEATATEQTRSEEDRAIYAEVVKRLKDMQSASRFD